MAFRYKLDKKVKKRHIIRLFIILFFVLLASLALAITYWYNNSIRALDDKSDSYTQIALEEGMNEAQFSARLQDEKIIRSASAMQVFIRLHGQQGKMQAGVYKLSPKMKIEEIVNKIINGDVFAELVTILPAQRIDQIKETFAESGFSNDEIESALDPMKYRSHPVLVDKPSLASLEGYIYPESYMKTSNTSLETIITASLDQMYEMISSDFQSAYKSMGLSNFQAITIASIVEKEVNTQEDRDRAAQVFIKRYNIGMPLGSDVTAYYGAEMYGLERSVSADTPYNTRLYVGLPPGPINNVSLSSLKAVAHPSDTDYLYFVTGDDGTTHFSKTLEEHEALTAKYCIELCAAP